jgi:hypothetical protein
MKRSLLAITRIPTGESPILGTTMRAATSIVHAAFIEDAAILVLYQKPDRAGASPEERFLAA